MESRLEPPSDRTRVRRLPERASYEPELIERILDEALVAHVGLADGDQPFVMPMTYVRVGSSVYFHGSSKSRLVLRAAQGIPLCFTVTLVDGLVFARSAFHHSMNYRSVIVLARGRLVDDDARKRQVLDLLVDRFASRRSEVVRPPSELELRATGVIELPLAEASAKVRVGGPKDDPEDLDRDCWAGVLPLGSVFRPAIPDVGLSSPAEAPVPGPALCISPR